MKHIKRKFLISLSKDDIKNKQIYQGYKEGEISDINLGQYDTSKLIYLESLDETIYGAFKVKSDGHDLLLPVPDPTLIYFNYAHLTLSHIVSTKKTLKHKLSLASKIEESGKHELYYYFGHVSSCIVLLFTSIESFINQQIPQNYIYSVSTTKSTTSYNSTQIQRYLSFNDKIKKILPDITKRDFCNSHPPTYQHIANLKDFRDMIVHTKVDNSEIQHLDLVKRTLSFKYHKTFEAVAKFMNYYKDDYIEECDCGSDF